MNKTEKLRELITIRQEMKPCPFCGSEVEMKYSGRDGINIRCSKCRIGFTQRAGTTGIFRLEKTMIKKWNTRT